MALQRIPPSTTLIHKDAVSTFLAALLLTQATVGRRRVGDISCINRIKDSSAPLSRKLRELRAMVRRTRTG